MALRRQDFRKHKDSIHIIENSWSIPTENIVELSAFEFEARRFKRIITDRLTDLKILFKENAKEKDYYEL